MSTNNKNNAKSQTGNNSKLQEKYYSEKNNVSNIIRYLESASK